MTQNRPLSVCELCDPTHFLRYRSISPPLPFPIDSSLTCLPPLGRSVETRLTTKQSMSSLFPFPRVVAAPLFLSKAPPFCLSCLDAPYKTNMESRPMANSPPPPPGRRSSLDFTSFQHFVPILLVIHFFHIYGVIREDLMIRPIGSLMLCDGRV